MKFHVAVTAVQSARIGITKAGKRRHQGSGLWDSGLRQQRGQWRTWLVHIDWQAKFSTRTGLYTSNFSAGRAWEPHSGGGLPIGNSGSPARAWEQ